MKGVLASSYSVLSYVVEQMVCKVLFQKVHPSMGCLIEIGVLPPILGTQASLAHSSSFPKQIHTPHRKDLDLEHPVIML